MERKFVDFYARSSKVPLDVAERDVVLTYVLKILSKDVLANLIFKGGTCLKKVFFGGIGRFSMDLDFTNVGVSVEELRKILANVLNDKQHYGIRFKIVEENIRQGFEANDESYITRVNYVHGWNSSEFTLEVSYRETPILAPSEMRLLNEMYFKYLEFPSFSLKCLQREELLAEKLRAAFQRIRGRDLYDLYLFSGRTVDKVRTKKLFVLKCWNVREPFEPGVLFEKISGGEYDWDDLQRLVRRKGLPSEATVVKKVIAEYSFLSDLDSDLLRIIKDSKAHKESSFVAAFMKLV